MMASNEDLQDNSTQKILEYYQKYSENSNLPKYFSGSSVQYLPLPVIDMPIPRNDQNTIKVMTTALEPIKTLPICKISLGPEFKTTLDPKNIFEEENSDKDCLNTNLHNSPLQSPSDNKKLEWDNGADIGYHITQDNNEIVSLRKCVSLPLLDNLKDTELKLNIPDINIILGNDLKIICSSTSDSNSSLKESLHDDEFKSDSLTSSCISKTKSTREFSSDIESGEAKLLDFEKTLSYLKKKIGFPGAHSTPNVQDVNKIPDFKKTMTSTSKNSNKKDKSYTEVKSINKTNMDTDINKNVSSQNLSKANKKVIELTISKPIIIDWIGSDMVGKDSIGSSEVQSSVQPFLKSKTVQNKGIFQQSKSKKPLKTNNIHFATFSGKNEAVNIHKENSGGSSNCDSFEYIGNVDITSTKHNKILQVNKNDLPVVGNTNPLNLLIGSEKDVLITDCTAPSRESSRMCSFSSMEKNSLSSLESSHACIKKDNVQSQSFTEPERSADYLLQFAENERAYQINWIDNEISHLSKLKNILELKNSKNFSKRKRNQTSFHKQPLKTSVYKITQQDSNSQESDREYVIQRKVDVSTDKQINYCLQGKKYSIADDQLPSTSTNSNKKCVEKCISANIKVQAEDKQTNIRISPTSCCKTESSVCQAKTSEKHRIGNTTHTQSSLSKLDATKTVPHICSICQEFTCVCQDSVHYNISSASENENVQGTNHKHVCIGTTKENNLPLKSDTIVGSDFPEYSNSLQKIFQKCSCTVENKECQCLFVKKLLSHLLSNKKDFSQNLSSSTNETNSSHGKKDGDTVSSDIEKIDSSNVKLKESTVHDLKQTKDPSIPNMNFQEEVLDNGSALVKIGFNKHHVTFNKEEGVDTKNDKDIGIHASVSKHVNEITKCGTTASSVDSSKHSELKSDVKYNDVGVQVSTNILMESEHPNKQKNTVTDNEGTLRTKDKSTSSTSKINTQYNDSHLQDTDNLIKCSGKRENAITNTEDLTATEDNRNVLTLIGLPSKQNEIVNTGGVTTEDSTVRLIRNSKNRDIGVQVIINLSDKNRNTKHNLIDNSEYVTGVEYEDTGVQENVLSTKNKYINEVHNKITDKNVAKIRDDKINLELEMDTKSKDTAVQASVGFQDYSTQTSERSQCNKCCGQKRASYEVSTQKKVRNDNKSDKNIALVTDTNIRNDSEIIVQGESQEDNNHADIQTKIVKEEATSDSYSQPDRTSESIVTSVFDSQSVPSSRITCVCCKKKAFVAEVCYTQNGNSSYAVCSRCHYNNRKLFYGGNYSHHPHMCLKSCVQIGQMANCNYMCTCCKCRLRKCSIIPPGVSYTLTLQEPSTKQTLSTKREKIFYLNNGANGINKENDYQNKSKQHAHPLENERLKTNSKKNKMSHPKLLEENKPHYTITDYLMMNRPEFIYSAENRRQTVLNSRILREHQKDVLKLHFLENNVNHITDKGQYKLFTEREMRNITKKNYQKLPETQKKLTSLREKRLRDADKLIRDIFAKKVQKSALQGQWNFPIDKTLTDYQ